MNVDMALLGAGRWDGLEERGCELSALEAWSGFEDGDVEGLDGIWWCPNKVFERSKDRGGV